MTAQMQFDQVSYHYADAKVDALQNFSLGIKAGSINVVLGANGAGKTTLLNLALGWFKPKKGRVCLNGRDLTAFGRGELGRQMALVPQSEHIPYAYSVLEYVSLGRAPHLPVLGAPSKQDYIFCQTCLDAVGMADFGQKSMLALSGGERQLVMIARALAQAPQILLLDEPTSHLDLGHKALVLRLLARLNQQGMTLLFSTHDPEVALHMATQVVLMHNGHLVCAGDAGSTLTGERLSNLYHLQVQMVEINENKFLQWW